MHCRDGWVGVNVLTAQQWADVCTLFEVPRFVEEQKNIQSDLPIAGEFFAAIQPWLWGGLIAGLVLALITIFAPKAAPFTSPLYALAEGLFLGALSAFVEMQYPGIAFQAVGLTFCTLFAMLVLYTTGVIRATPAFRRGIMAATFGIMMIYLLSWILRMFGVEVPYIHGSGLVGIGFSLFVVVIAAMNLVLDFDLIEEGAKRGSPKYMEWFAAFGLLVTLVWLYIEILRLLSKLRQR